MTEISKSFYFKAYSDATKQIYKIYSIPYSIIDLIPFFKTLVENNPDQSISKETAFPICPILINDPDCINNSSYYINTIELFDIIIEYIEAWKSEPKKINYIKEDVVQTGYAHQILDKRDLDIINQYLTKKIADAPENDKNKIKTHVTYKKYYKIMLLAPLIRMCDEFLQMDCISNKLYVYCATILWNCSILDMAEAKTDPIFRELQSSMSKRYQTHSSETHDKTGEKNAAFNN